MYLLACLVLVLSLMWPVSSRAQSTLLVLESEPGDYIGGGSDQTFTLAHGTFNATRNFDGGVSISFRSPTLAHWWDLDFAAPGGAPLTPGTYQGATRFPFQEPDQPGLSVSGEGRGCNTLTGQFEVLEIRYGPGDTVLSFAASFEQHCEGAAPALRGSILFNSGAPVPPDLTLTLTGCTSCSAGDHFAVSGRLTNPGDRALVVEIKIGVRLPDGTALSLLDGEHFVVTLPVGFDATFPLANLQVPAGLPTGAWHLEGTVLESSLAERSTGKYASSRSIRSEAARYFVTTRYPIEIIRPSAPSFSAVISFSTKASAFMVQATFRQAVIRSRKRLR